MTAALTLSYPEPDIALLTFDLPGKRANVMSAAVLTEFETLLDELAQRTELAGLIIRSGKPGTFIAGADLHEISALRKPAVDAAAVAGLCRRGHAIWSRLAELHCVSVAAIDGICLGGGTELSLWCDCRIVSDSPRTEIGLPEVKLGLLPGWGGTVRLPRIIGLPPAIEMITSGEPVTVAAAVQMGLATDAVPEPQLLSAAIALVREQHRSGAFHNERKRRRLPVAMNPAEFEFLAANQRAKVAQQAHGNPAPAAVLELMLAAASQSAVDALTSEAAAFADLFASPASGALLNVFFLTDRNKRDLGIEGTVPAVAPAKSLGIVGAGIMGVGIAAAAIKRGLPAVLSDASPDVLTQALPRAVDEAAYSKARHGPDPQRAREAVVLLSSGEGQLAACDVVIEAIVETPSIKQQLYGRLEPSLREGAILASNTSTIPITRLAEGLLRPHRFCGMHFFNPVARMKLVEVVRGAKTSDETIADAVALAKRIGKMPVVVNDGPGFMVNRLLFPYMNEAIELLHDGIAIEQIDRAAMAFGMPIGPIGLYDLVGLDTAMHCGRTMWEAFPSRVVASPMVPALVKRGRLGIKAGRGFFNYENKQRRPERDPLADKLVAGYERRRIELTDELVQQRLFMPMLLEATRLLEEHVARDVRDIDLGLIFGLGFPTTKGGLLYWADTLGAAKLLTMLEPLQSLGARMQPTPMLLRMAETDGKFYPA